MKIVNILFCVLVSSILFGCHKKSNPSKMQVSSGMINPSVNKTDTKKPAIRQIKTPVPKVITVNDNAAKKTFDGRLYYDLEGRRYWRNYKDGKYYLYHISMNTNPDFKKP